RPCWPSPAATPPGPGSTDPPTRRARESTGLQARGARGGPKSSGCAARRPGSVPGPVSPALRSSPHVWSAPVRAGVLVTYMPPPENAPPTLVDITRDGDEPHSRGVTAMYDAAAGAWVRRAEATGPELWATPAERSKVVAGVQTRASRVSADLRTPR